MPNYKQKYLNKRYFLNIVMELQEKVHKVRLENRKLQMVQLGECAFADDLMISAGNKKLQLWENEI